MEKTEALSEIRNCIDRVKNVKGFHGKAQLLKRLRTLHEMVDMYKADGNYFELCAEEAVKLITILKEGLTGGK
ncbi:hypothetical protein ES702_02182 [subsurface metagenome]